MADESPKPPSTPSESTGARPALPDDSLSGFGRRLNILAEEVGNLRSRIDRQETKEPPPPPESSYLLNTMLDLKETSGRLDERMIQQERMLQGIAGELRGMQQAMLSKTQYWMGIGLVLTVLLGLASMYFSFVKP